MSRGYVKFDFYMSKLKLMCPNLKDKYKTAFLHDVYNVINLN